MIQPQSKVVWILGAGFSRALGGPLLHDLLRPYPEGVLEKLYVDFVSRGQKAKPDQEARRQTIVSMDRIRRLFSSPEVPQPWGKDAEQFLEFVETAAEESSEDVFQGAPPSYAGPILKEAGRGSGFEDLQDLALAAKRAIAADCSLFLRGAQPESEKWNPYKEWAQNLTANDVVVTFNYDTIPELLEKFGGKLLVALPGELESIKARASTENKASVYKVHGSVNWYMTLNRQVACQKDHHNSIDLTGDAWLINQTLDDFVMGVPGPQKQNLITGCLQPLWKEAMSCIQASDLVIFIGYRFPPSDARARQDILGALRAGNPQVVTVLGPTSPDAARMASLLDTAMGMKAYAPRALPLFAEDFLSLYRHIDLW
jgi:hypothetical protein